eukprot:349604-Chlamydomonas_euryale.AAC.7
MPAGGWGTGERGKGVKGDVRNREKGAKHLTRIPTPLLLFWLSSTDPHVSYLCKGCAKRGGGGACEP